jgi:hypothetical protein
MPKIVDTPDVRYLLQCISVAIFLVLAPSKTGAGETPPPPTNGVSAVNIGTFGLVDPGSNLFHSYDTGTQIVGTPFFPSYWYSFSVILGDSLKVTDTDSTIVNQPGLIYNLYAGDPHDPKLLGPASQFSSLVVGSCECYIAVSADHPTSFHFGLIIHPDVSKFSNDAGRTEATALSLGTLAPAIDHGNDFYTYYFRQYIVTNGPATPGTLVPDFQRPTPNPPVQSDFYSFILPKPTTVVVHVGKLPPHDKDDIFIVYKRGIADYQILRNGDQASLVSGNYILQVVDKETHVAGSGSTLIITRIPTAENFEHYTFSIVDVNAH